MERRQFLWFAALMSAPGLAQTKAQALYRPRGGKLQPLSPTELVELLARRLVAVRNRTWQAEASHGQGLGVLFGAQTNEEGYLWAKLARLVGFAHLELVNEAAYRASALALESTLGYPAAPDHPSELTQAQTLVIIGNPPQSLNGLPKSRWLVTTASQPRPAAQILKIRPGTELALLGGWLRYLFAEKRWDETFVQQATNGAYQLEPGLSFTEGIFSDLDPKSRRYQPTNWRYLTGQPVPAADPLSPGTVLQWLADLYAPYTPQRVAQVTGVPLPQLERFYQQVTDPKARLALAYHLGNMSQSGLAEQLVRALIMVQLLTGQTGPGSLIHLGGSGNPQGLMDVGANGTFLPGYSGQVPRVGADYASWVKANGTQALRRLQGILLAWHPTAARQAYDLGFHWLPKTPLVSLRQAVTKGETKLLLSLASDPSSLGWDLTRLESLVVTSQTPGLSQFSGELFVLPLVAGSGTMTDLGRRVYPVDRREPGSLPLVDQLWRAIIRQLQATQAPNHRHLANLPWPDSTPTQIRQEMNGTAFLNPSAGLPDQNRRAGVPIYEGLPTDLDQDGWRWPNHQTRPERPYPQTPEGVARLVTVEYTAGLNLDTGISARRLPQPQLGPVPVFYWPWSSKVVNPFYPKQPTPPVRP
ncbi:hypothetical protein [Candidatus Cyanaurora vandensis]|uniref:hypothetical protein n=1 Tax=Candidatus Cyanaurora vandensis TaxID=2714958 RepID=UPI00257F715C|nr:hypothetical protein [Candidatus Cyanaurora vandensis]